jgi:nucleoside phosphorylase
MSSMRYLHHSRRALSDQLIERRCSKQEIAVIFEHEGFERVELGALTKRVLIRRFYDQVDWAERSSAEKLFPVLNVVLAELKRKSTEEASASGRMGFARLVKEGLWLDGLEYEGRVRWKSGIPPTVAVQPPERGPEPKVQHEAARGGTASSVERPEVLVKVAERLTDVLARVAHDPDDAKRIARRAGFPPGHIPSFKTAYVFWSTLIDRALSGMVPLGSLASIMLEELQHNAEIREIAGIIVANTADGHEGRAEPPVQASASQSDGVRDASPGKGASRVSDAPVDGIDLLLLTALPEEHQVVSSVLERVGKHANDGDRYDVFELGGRAGHGQRVGLACSQQIGGIGIGVLATSLFEVLRPRLSVLVGISAVVDVEGLRLGDVQLASQVIGYDDIAARDGIMTFRTETFQTDPGLRRKIDRIRSSRGSYASWQDQCCSWVADVVNEIQGRRRAEIVVPQAVDRPHFVVEPLAGGPILLRDAGLRDALRRPASEQHGDGFRVSAPLHPKLTASEMESGGFMRAAHESQVRASVVKGISDLGDGGKTELERSSGGFFRLFACLNAALLVVHALDLQTTG